MAQSGLNEHEAGARGATRFGEYELLEVLGRGGAATVVRARGPARPDRPSIVALKFLHDDLLDDLAARSAFQNEGSLGLLVQHPHLIRTFGFEIAAGQSALVLECVEGSSFFSLHRQLLRQPWMIRDQYATARVCAEASRGLAALHDVRDPDGKPLHSVHRDVSLGNLIVDETGMAKVIDLGVAFTENRSLRTNTGTVKGKLAYMAPEYLEGKPWDRRIDVWSTGVVLWEMLTGRRLFRGESPSQTVCAVVTATVPHVRSLRRELSPELDRIAMRALERKPERRYSSNAELAEDLEACWARECPGLEARDVVAWINRLPLGALSGVRRVARAPSAAPGTPTPAETSPFVEQR